MSEYSSDANYDAALDDPVARAKQVGETKQFGRAGWDCKLHCALHDRRRFENCLKNIFMNWVKIKSQAQDWRHNALLSLGSASSTPS